MSPQIPIASVMGKGAQNSKCCPGLAWEGFGFPGGSGSPGARASAGIRDVWVVHKHTALASVPSLQALPRHRLGCVSAEPSLSM